jgi:hypothetical protein
MDAPARRPADTSYVGRGDQCGKNTPHPVHQVTADLAVVIVLNQALHAPVADRAYLHAPGVRRQRNLDKASRADRRARANLKTLPVDPVLW